MAIRILLGLALAAGYGIQGITLDRQPKIGETSKLRITLEIDMQGNAATYSVLQTEKVIAVEPNGSYTVESKQTEARVKYGDQTNAIPDAPARTAIYKASGEPLSGKSEPLSSEAMRMARMNAFVSPGREIKLGDSWIHEYAGDPLKGEVSAKAEYKAETKETVGGHATIVIRFSYRETSGDKAAASAGKMWIEAGTGSLIKLESDLTNAPLAGAPRPLNARITILREE